MKLVKKMLVMIIAVVMVLGTMSMSVFADGTGSVTADAKVTVSDLAEGDVAHFYKVIEWINADETHAGGWAFTDAFKSLTEDDLKAITGDPSKTPAVPSALTAELAGKIARLAKGDGTEVNVGGDNSAELTITGADGAGSGMFLVLITPKDANTVYNPVFVAADYVSTNASNTWKVGKDATYSDKAAAKKSELNLDKTAETTEDNWDDKKSYTTAIGDTVSFTVNTKIPGYGKVYENPHFVLKDSLTDLKLKADTVKIVKPADLEKETDYKITTTDSGYTIEFTKDYLKKVSTATDVQVTYDAIVTSDAAKNINTEKNEVTIEYSHDPTKESDYDIKKDTTQHYTFSLDAGLFGGTSSEEYTSELVKVGVDAAGNPIKTEMKTKVGESKTINGPLQGAVFGLYTDAACKNGYVSKNADGTTGSTPLTVTTGSDGRMEIKGLDAGTYYLKEISAPEGYIKDTKSHKIEISADVDEVEIKETIGDKEVTYKTDVLKSYSVKIDGKEAANYTFSNDGKSTEVKVDKATETPFEIKNTQGTELPSTGGIGTKIFYAIGAVLVIGAGILLVTRRRMRTR